MLLMRNYEAGMALDSFEKEVILAESARSGFLSENIFYVKKFYELESHARHIEARLAALENSISWKITSPLRAFIRSIKRTFRIRATKAASIDDIDPVTVVITTFNQSTDQLERCLASVLMQTFVRIKLVVWDDGSTNPETIRCLHNLNDSNDPRVFVNFSENRGVVSARNSAARISNSKYIVFLDPDDFLEITYIEKVLLFAGSHIGKSLAVVNTDVVVHGHNKVDIWRTEELSWPDITNHNQLAICSLINLQAFNSVGGFSDAMSDGFEDWELWVRLASHGYVSKRIPEPLFHYSFQESSGRDAGAKTKSSELQTRIKALNSKVKHDFIGDPELVGVSQKMLDHSIVFPASEKSSVFIFVPWLPKAGGAETFLKLLASGLKESGRTVCFVSTQESSPSIDDFFKVTPFVYELPKFLKPESYLSFVNNLLSRTPHNIILNSGSRWLYENLDSLDSLQVGKTKAYDILYNPIGHLPNFLQNQDSFTGVVAVYKNLAKLLDEYFAVQPEVKYIPVGIDQLPLVSIESESKKIRIGWLGRLSSEKRPDWFIRMATVLEGECEFTMAGDGPLRDELQLTLPAKSHTHSNIEFLGHVSDGLEYIRSLDLLINTSSIEGISVTAMEALSQGVPVVSPRVGGMEDLIEYGVNGLLYDPDDFQGLVSVVNKLIQTPGELARLKDSTRDTLLPNEFKFEKMLQAYEDLFEDRA